MWQSAELGGGADRGATDHGRMPNEDRGSCYIQPTCGLGKSKNAAAAMSQTELGSMRSRTARAQRASSDSQFLRQFLQRPCPEIGRGQSFRTRRMRQGAGQWLPQDTFKVESKKIDLLLATRRPRFEHEKAVPDTCCAVVPRIRFRLRCTRSAMQLSPRVRPISRPRFADGARAALRGARRGERTSRRFRRRCTSTRGAASAALPR